MGNNYIIYLCLSMKNFNLSMKNFNFNNCSCIFIGNRCALKERKDGIPFPLFGALISVVSVPEKRKGKC